MDNEQKYFYYPGVGNKESKIYTPMELYQCILTRILCGYPAVCMIPSVKEFINEEGDNKTLIQEKLNKGELKKYTSDYIIPQKETFYRINFERESRGKQMIAFFGRVDYSLKNFCKAYGPFDTMGSLEGFKEKYEELILPHIIDEEKYNFSAKKWLDRLDLLWKQINQIDNDWFSDFGPMITPLYLDVFHKGYEIITDYVIGYEKQIHFYNSKMRYHQMEKHVQMKKLRREYSYEMEHIESIWEKEQKTYIYNSDDDSD